MNQATLSERLPARWTDYLELCKPRIVVMIVFTAVVGMFLSVPGMVPWAPLVFGSLGIAFAAASSAVLNHVVDQRQDALMARTRNRPLPTSRVGMTQALVLASVLSVLAMVILALLVNTLTALLTLFSLVGYGYVYTALLKPATPQNIVIGGAAGAAPPVLGWTAVTGTLDPNALLLFIIVFAWTPPHFWALALHQQKEYARAGVPMLPVTHGSEFTRLHILLYTILTIIASIMPVLSWMSGLVYLLCSIPLNAVFLYYAVRMMQTDDNRIALRAFYYSIYYLLLLFAALLVDHYFMYPVFPA